MKRKHSFLNYTRFETRRISVEEEKDSACDNIQDLLHGRSSPLSNIDALNRRKLNPLKLAYDPRCRKAGS